MAVVEKAGDRLVGIVGDANVSADCEVLSRHAVDGAVPEIVVSPSTSQEVTDVCRAATDSKSVVVPWGGGTMQSIGASPISVFTVLCMGRMNGIVEHDAENMTVTVEPGITLDAVQAVLAEKNQFLPLDPPMASRATLGGVISSNASGPCRIMYGTARDMMLGVRSVLASGDIFSSGGKTVKNVAGYDTGKLFVGSFGTLGVIVEAAFRTMPLPERRALICSSFSESGQASAAAGDFARAQFSLSALELVGDSGGWRLWVGLEGDEQAVKSQADRAMKQLNDAGAKDVSTLQKDEMVGAWQELRDNPCRTASGESVMRCKAATSISKIGEFLDDATRVASERALGISSMAHAGCGVIYLRLGGDSVQTDPVGTAKGVGELRTTAQRCGGYLVVEAAPVEVKNEVDVWDRSIGGLEVMKSIREQFDPHGILNPGRFVT